VSLADDKRDEDDLAITRVRPEWCAADTGGVLICLYLTAVQTAWIPEMIAAVRAAAAHREDRRVAAMTVLSLDKRYPLDIGFDSSLAELREGVREMAPCLRASAFVLEIDGFLASMMMAAISTLGSLAQSRYPRSIHPTVISGVRWLAPHVNAEHFLGVRHYVDAVNRMKTELGCLAPSQAQGRGATQGRSWFRGTGTR
jgi:hypothetical protein